jgi:benzoyl-CoA reductase/2-hydroxyglutaryl-CoA dehydratase subunit BcrC/BadD/HgdB
MRGEFEMQTNTITKIDFGPVDKTLGILEQILAHRRAHPKFKSDEYYYEFLIQTLRSIRYAKEEGKILVATTVLIPTEILYAMDIVPMNIEFVTGIVAESLQTYEDDFSTAKAFGFAPEICSVHRIINAHVLRGILPRPDGVIWSNQVCDNTAKGGDCLMEMYGVPGYFVDRPYRYTEPDVTYLVAEFQGMISFLEKISGRKLDWDRLKESVRQSNRSVEIYREIYKLREAVPSPIKSRRFTQFNTAEQLFPGSPEALKWLEQVLVEVKENVEKGKGVVPKERYRILHLFMPPFSGGQRLLDWMEEEHGAISIAEPYCTTWGPGELDPERPLESLARKTFIKPIARQMHGPVSEGVLVDTLHDARLFKADGAIFWAHYSCREACACIKVVKDGLMEKMGIPTLVVDMDLCDATFVTTDQIKDKLEGFFEILDDRR